MNDKSQCQIETPFVRLTDKNSDAQKTNGDHVVCFKIDIEEKKKYIYIQINIIYKCILKYLKNISRKFLKLEC